MKLYHAYKIYFNFDFDQKKINREYTKIHMQVPINDDLGG